MSRSDDVTPRLGDTLQGDGLSLRIWEATDADSLRAALAVSDDAFRDWLPGVLADTRDVPAFLRSVAELFQAGTAFLYAVVVADEVVGQCTLHPQPGGEGVIGYWVRSDRTGDGIATAAVEALTSAAFAEGFRRLELRCDEANVRSAAVARKTGFTCTATLDAPGARTPAQSGREMIWAQRNERAR